MFNLLILYLRSALFYTGYISGTVIMSSIFLLVAPFLSIPNRFRYTATWCDWILRWLRLSCGVTYQIQGKENLPTSPVVLLANHQSSWETLLFYRLVSPVAPILKKELFRIPFWGWALWLQHPIAIDRGKPQEAGKSLLIQGIDRIRQGYSIIIFPEGTRSSIDTIKRFSRSGARLATESHIPVVPVAHNAGHCWPPRQFLKRPGNITVVIGEPIPSQGQDAASLTQQAEDWIRGQVAAIGHPS